MTSQDSYMVYLDKSSVNVIRYDPPYYIIDGVFVYIDYSIDRAGLITERYFYDMKLNTIKRQQRKIDFYDLQGNFLSAEEYPDRSPELLEGYSNGWQLANYLFSLAYEKPFSAF